MTLSSLPDRFAVNWSTADESPSLVGTAGSVAGSDSAGRRPRGGTGRTSARRHYLSNLENTGN